MTALGADVWSPGTVYRRCGHTLGTYCMCPEHCPFCDWQVEMVSSMTSYAGPHFCSILSPLLWHLIHSAQGNRGHFNSDWAMAASTCGGGSPFLEGSAPRLSDSILYHSPALWLCRTGQQKSQPPRGRSPSSPVQASSPPGDRQTGREEGT